MTSKLLSIMFGTSKFAPKLKIRTSFSVFLRRFWDLRIVLPGLGDFTFVTFHVETTPDSTVHPNTTLAEAEYVRMINFMFASAQKFCQKMKAVVLTDSSTALDGLISKANVVRQSVNTEELMLERSRMQLQYLRDSKLRTPVVFLDSDILINGPINKILKKKFDIALTVRDHSEMPINGGIIILNNRQRKATIQFFERYVGNFERNFRIGEKWYGDQLALSDLVFDDSAKYLGGARYDVNGCRVLIIPASEFNYSPNEDTEFSTKPLTQSVLHFKGARKQLMFEYQKLWHI